MTLVRVGAVPGQFEAAGVFFDGRTGTRHMVRIWIDELSDRLVASVGSDELARWPISLLRMLPDQADPNSVVLARSDDPLARIHLAREGFLEAMRSRAPNLKKAPPVQGRRRLFLWSLAAVGSVALMLMVLVPLLADQLADILPPKAEVALGEATFDQIRDALAPGDFAPLGICTERAGQKALDTMRARLTDGLDLAYPVQVTVLDTGEVNAFALPGGQVVLFRGLIRAAETPEEVAAVFAHEIGHVAARDPTRIAMRTAGSSGILGLLLGDFAGGAVVLFLANRIVQADYTQEAEAAADAYAADLLRSVGLSPRPLADFFERLQKSDGATPGLVQHFLSHPALGDRIAATRAAAEPAEGTRPLLTEAEWQALRQICR